MSILTVVQIIITFFCGLFLICIPSISYLRKFCQDSLIFQIMLGGLFLFQVAQFWIWPKSGKYSIRKNWRRILLGLSVLGWLALAGHLFKGYEVTILAFPGEEIRISDLKDFKSAQIANQTKLAQNPCQTISECKAQLGDGFSNFLTKLDQLDANMNSQEFEAGLQNTSLFTDALLQRGDLLAKQQKENLVAKDVLAVNSELWKKMVNRWLALRLNQPVMGHVTEAKVAFEVIRLQPIYNSSWESDLGQSVADLRFHHSTDFPIRGLVKNQLIRGWSLRWNRSDHFLWIESEQKMLHGLWEEGSFFADRQLTKILPGLISHENSIFSKQTPFQIASNLGHHGYQAIWTEVKSSSSTSDTGKNSLPEVGIGGYTLMELQLDSTLPLWPAVLMFFILMFAWGYYFEMYHHEES